MKRLALLILAATLVAGCGSSETKQESKKTTPENTEETTVLREKTEETTAMEFSVGRSPMEEEPEEEDDRDRATRQPSKASPEPTPQQIPPEAEKAQPQPEPELTPEPQVQPVEEEPAPPEAVQPETECRFFTQSEFVQASPERKAFIQECDRAAGRVGNSPAPSPPPPVPLEPQPKAVPKAPSGGGRLTCNGLSPAEAQAALPANPQLDRDNDGIACEG